MCEGFFVITGVGVGSLVGGLVFEYYGAVYTFQGCAGFSIVTLVLYMTAVFCIRKGKRHNHAYSEGNVRVALQVHPNFAIAIPVDHIWMILCGSGKCIKSN